VTNKAHYYVIVSEVNHKLFLSLVKIKNDQAAEDKKKLVDSLKI
jgi:hypothetical protein